MNWIRRAGAVLTATGVILTGATPTAAETIRLRVAAASNLSRVAGPLLDAFESQHPGIQLEVTHAATGNLVAQITHGAPFDVLLAADLEYPQTLIDRNLARSTEPVIYGHGILMLWPASPGIPLDEQLKDPTVSRVAIAHPDIAPYGLAARAWLQAKNLWPMMTPKIITGENVAQTLQFVSTGHADIGFVAAALLPECAESAQVVDVPDDSLAHGAIVLRRTNHPAVAHKFLTWLTSAEARELLIQHGYRAP